MTISDTSLTPKEVELLVNYPNGAVFGKTPSMFLRQKESLHHLFNADYGPVQLADPAEIVKFNAHTEQILGGSVGPNLNGLEFTKPVLQNHTNGTNRQLLETPLPVPVTEEQKQQASGVIILEPDGRIWLFSPRNFFMGYNFTFPKGQTLEKGETERNDPQETAIQEALQETGLNVKIIGVQGDYDRGKRRMGRVYIAKRVGGSPFAWKGSPMQPLPSPNEKNEIEETAAVWLVPPDKLLELAELNVPRSFDGIQKINPDIQVFKDTIKLIELAKQKGKTLEDGFNVLSKEAVQATGYSDLAPYLRKIQPPQRSLTT